VTIRAPQLIAELAGDFLPYGLTEEIAEPDAPIGQRIGEKDAPPVLRQLDVLEVRPTLRDRRSPPVRTYTWW